MGEQSPTRPGLARKRDGRQKRFLVGLMTSETHKPQRIVITNLSAFGLSCRAVHPPEVDERVTILLGAFGEADGQIRWRLGRNFGVKLDEEIDVIAIGLAKCGFRSADYDLPLDPKFENMMVFEFFRDAEYHEIESMPTDGSQKPSGSAISPTSRR